MNILTKKFDVGVVIGRFQVDALHTGHIEMLDHVQAAHDRVILFLGIPALQYGSLNNPLDYQARMQMIQERYPHFLILPLQDRRTNERWSEALDGMVRNVINPRQTVVLYGGRDSFIPFYKGKFATIQLEGIVGSGDFLSGTEIRNRIKNTAKLDESFRRGAIWQTFNRYPACLTTVDVAIVNRTKSEVLLAKKPGEVGWRFVGGFAEPNSASFEADAMREVREETGLEVSNPVYVSSHLVDDWRLRSEKDKIKTMLFTCDYIFGTPKADDDICEVGWHSYKNNIIFVPEHEKLYTSFTQFIIK